MLGSFFSCAGNEILFYLVAGKWILKIEKNGIDQNKKHPLDVKNGFKKETGQN